MKKPNINKAFRMLRKLGYFAKQNFWCCSTCGWSAMTEEESKKAVFYHMQDNDNLKEQGACYLSWSGDGQEIVKTLSDSGVKTEWSGKSGERIKIHLS